MSVTIEFFVAEPQELVTVFSLQDEQEFLARLKTYTVTDFSFHLVLPDDLDRLCLALAQQQIAAPAIFRDFLTKQLWYDGSSESMTLLSENFVDIFAGLDDATVINVAYDWGQAFHYQEPLEATPAYQALLQLRNSAQYAVAQKKPLILHLVF